MHKWISTDYGSQCYRCGVVLDYRTPDYEGYADGGEPYTPAEQQLWEDESFSLVPSCTGPETPRAHHYVYGLHDLDCAYGDAHITMQSYETVPMTCIGA